jgi:hypothetical protein
MHMLNKVFFNFLVAVMEFGPCAFAFALYECMTSGLSEKEKQFWNLYDDSDQILGFLLVL